MTAKVEPAYQRSTLRLLVGKPISEGEALGMVGHPLEASTPDSTVVLGMVSSAKLVDDGRALMVTVETGGRACMLCGEVYRDEQIHAGMRPVREYREAITEGEPWASRYAGLPDGALVCALVDYCERMQATTLARRARLREQGGQ